MLEMREDRDMEEAGVRREMKDERRVGELVVHSGTFIVCIYQSNLKTFICKIGNGSVHPQMFQIVENIMCLL